LSFAATEYLPDDLASDLDAGPAGPLPGARAGPLAEPRADSMPVPRPAGA